MAFEFTSLLASADQAKTVVREKEYRARVFGVRSIDSIVLGHARYVPRSAYRAAPCLLRAWLFGSLKSA